MNAIDVNITWNKIEDCHRLEKKKHDVIVQVINRKHLKALRNKKKLKSNDKNATGIPNKNLFIKENLTLLNSKLPFICQKLKRDGEIEKCYCTNGIAHIAKNVKLMKIYLKDLQKLFP